MLLGEFIYKGVVYCIKTPSDKDYDDDEIIRFSRLEDIQAFFASASDDPAAWPVIMTIAKFFYPGICRPPANCPEPTDQDFLNALCLQIYKGPLKLIEVTPDREWVMRDLQLKECCIETIKDINSTIMNGNILVAVDLLTPIFQTFFYPSGYNKWAGLASTVFSIRVQDWKDLGESVKSISKLIRDSVFDKARTHAIKHEIQNDYKLKLFWQGVANEFE